MRLLVIEDNEKLASLIKKLLTDSGFAVDAVESAETAVVAMKLADYDLIVLDLSLPDQDGSDFLFALRRESRDIPVLIATARSDVAERVRTLNLGADDYLVKPFSPEELVARIRALLRRPKKISDPILVLGNVTLDTSAMMLQIGGKQIELPRRELNVLATLLGAQGRLLPKRKLEDAIYSFDSEVTPNAIEAAISRVRKRLETHGASVEIVAMRGLGYILAGRKRAEP
jgi:DNA-binding response OmpR family regulator